MEEDIDLRELIKAIHQGDKERAERIAITLFKKPQSNPTPKKSNPNEWMPVVSCVLAVAGIIVLSLMDLWFTRKEKRKKEVEEVV